MISLFLNTLKNIDIGFFFRIVLIISCHMQGKFSCVHKTHSLLDSFLDLPSTALTNWEDVSNFKRRYYAFSLIVK